MLGITPDTGVEGHADSLAHKSAIGSHINPASSCLAQPFTGWGGVFGQVSLNEEGVFAGQFDIVLVPFELPGTGAGCLHPKHDVFVFLRLDRGGVIQDRWRIAEGDGRHATGGFAKLVLHEEIILAAIGCLRIAQRQGNGPGPDNRLTVLEPLEIEGLSSTHHGRQGYIGSDRSRQVLLRFRQNYRSSPD